MQVKRVFRVCVQEVHIRWTLQDTGVILEERPNMETDGFLKLPSGSQMHSSGSFIMANICMDWHSTGYRTPAQIMWLFLPTIVRGLNEGLVEAKKCIASGLENAQRFLLQSTTFFPSDICKALSGLLSVSPRLLPLSQSMSGCESSTWDEMQASPSLSTPCHIISFHLSWSSSFQAPLCSFPTHTKSFLSPLLLCRPIPRHVSWALPNIPTDLIIALRAPSPSWPWTWAYHLTLTWWHTMSLGHRGTVYFPYWQAVGTHG